MRIMTKEKKVRNSKIRLEISDITDIETDAFVFYATEDLELGSGFGTAIAVRGGPRVQQELREIGSARPTEAVITSAGEMKAEYIIHAVGPKFQEEDTENKLAATIKNALNAAEEKGIKRLALPAMGAGFYGVPIDASAEITIDTVSKHLGNSSNIKEVTLCMLDSKQFKAYQQRLAKLS